MKLSDLVDAYMESDTRPAWLVVGRPVVVACIRRAVRFYLGYAKLTNGPEDPDEVHTLVTASDDLATPPDEQDFDLTPSEWAIIKPLFELYVEKQCAGALEATRGLGVDVYGRMTSEVSQDITLREQEMPKQAFCQPVFTV